MYTEQDTHLVHEYASLGKPFTFPTPATPLSQPAHLVHYNTALGETLGLKAAEMQSPKGIHL
ncbi:MAG: hypothetical protein R3194_02140, partial [Limnobacter sp.]|nr:hypothetical protein [Limnobacter sp.]